MRCNGERPEYARRDSSERRAHFYLIEAMGGQAFKEPPPVNIEKPKLENVPDEMKGSSFNPEMYSESSRPAAQKAYNLQMNAVNAFNQQRSAIEAANAAKMQQYKNQVAAAEAERQATMMRQAQIFGMQNPQMRQQMQQHPYMQAQMNQQQRAKYPQQPK